MELNPERFFEVSQCLNIKLFLLQNEPVPSRSLCLYFIFPMDAIFGFDKYKW